MATLKSKLKEQIQKEKDLAIEEYMKPHTDKELNIASEWLKSIQRLIKVCEDRKRY